MYACMHAMYLYFDRQGRWQGYLVIATLILYHIIVMIFVMIDYDMYLPPKRLPHSDYSFLPLEQEE
jgi:hypothetical protein